MREPLSFFFGLFLHFVVRYGVILYPDYSGVIFNILVKERRFNEK